jgi:hypothetical protein
MRLRNFILRLMPGHAGRFMWGGHSCPPAASAAALSGPTQCRDWQAFFNRVLAGMSK